MRERSRGEVQLQPSAQLFEQTSKEFERAVQPRGRAAEGEVEQVRLRLREEGRRKKEEKKEKEV